MYISHFMKKLLAVKFRSQIPQNYKIKETFSDSFYYFKRDF